MSPAVARASHTRLSSTSFSRYTQAELPGNRSTTALARMRARGSTSCCPSKRVESSTRSIASPEPCVAILRPQEAVRRLKTCTRELPLQIAQSYSKLSGQCNRAVLGCQREKRDARNLPRPDTTCTSTFRGEVDQIAWALD